MKKVWYIYKKDFKRIVENKVALVTVLILCTIPSLYAWINIKACWDPYSNTGNLPVAIVNDDRGTSLEGKDINVGAQIIEELKKDNSISWQFVDQWQGNYGVNEGKYYALIEIPSDFSSSLATLVTLNPKKPEIIYRANEKANAIATKITAVVKDKLTKEITTNFVETVNKEAFTFLNSLGGELQTNKGEIFQIRDALGYTSENIDKTIKLINDAGDDAISLENYLYTVKNNLPVLSNQIESLQSATASGKELIGITQSALNSLLTNCKNNVMEIQMINSKNQMLIAELKNINNSSSRNQLKEKASEYGSNLNKMEKLKDSAMAYSSVIDSLKSGKDISKIVNKLDKNNELVKAQRNILNSISKSIDSGVPSKDINELLDSLSQLSNEVTANLIQLSNIFYSEGVLAINNTSNKLMDKSTLANNILEGTKIIIPQLNALASFGIASTEVASKQAGDTATKLGNFQTSLNELNDKTKGVNENTINNLISIMGENPEIISNFIASPIEVKEEEVYKGGVFGVGITPFYTVLAIWVGALLASTILSTEFKGLKNIEGATLIHEHFGKMLIFLTISLIQGIVISIGDVFILGVVPESFGLFMTMTVLTSIVFTVIIFTLDSVLGNVGKAIAVIIMVIQIAGAGGLYPIQTNPKFFQIVNPYLPFTYSILGFREAIAGPLLHNTVMDILRLLLLGFAFFLLVLFKKPFHKLLHFFHGEFKKAGL